MWFGFSVGLVSLFVGPLFGMTDMGTPGIVGTLLGVVILWSFVEKHDPMLVLILFLIKTKIRLREISSIMFSYKE